MGYSAGSNPQLSHHHFPPASIFTSYPPWRLRLMKNSHGILEARSRRLMAGSPRACNPRGGSEVIHGGRRAFIFFGSLTLPCFNRSAGALDGFSQSDNAVSEDDNINTRTAEVIETKEPINEGSPSQNILLTLLNEVGIFGIGVLGSLYTLAQKDKQTTEAVIESLKSEISDKEGSMILLKKDMESKLVKEQEKWNNLLQKSKDEQKNILNQLSSANSNINALGNDLKNGKVAMEGLKGQISTLNSNLSKSREVKDSLEIQFKESVKSVESLQGQIISLEADLQRKKDDIQILQYSADKTNLQINELNENHVATKDELEKAILVIETLKDDLFESNNGLESSQALVNDQRSTLASLESEKAEIHERLTVLQDDHDDLKSSFKTKSAYNAKQLKKTEEELAILEEKSRLAVIELGEKQATITKLSEELDHCKELLKIETANVKKLRGELQSAQEAFVKEVSDMKNQLEEMNTKCSSLEQQNSTLLSQLSNSEERINLYENEMKIKEALTDELKSTHEQLQKVSEDLKAMSHKVEISTQENENLEKELEAMSDKAESLSNDLEVEKATVLAVRKEIEEQSVSEKEVQNMVLRLGKERESLEAENEILLNTLAEQKNTSMETLSSLEDAHNMVLRLGKERENLQTKATTLEKELASAKGEILRLRSQRNTQDGIVDSSIDVPSSPKKIVRRKKSEL